MLVDYHMHLRAPRDGSDAPDHTVETVERYVEQALAHGVDEIGVTEHVYYFRETQEFWTLPYQLDRCRQELDPYCDAVLEAKRRRLPVKLGLEVDWVPERADALAAVLAPYPWDYLIGSVHFVDGYGIDAEPSLVDAVGSEEAWRRYYEWLSGASERVDVLGHPDLVKFFGPELDWDWLSVAASLDGACLEVSSAGLHKPHGKLYPSTELLTAGKARGMPITTASDAHVPQNVGRDLDRAIEHARAAGYETVTVFDRRRPRQEPLG
jgi:histidinol-phosphatase (PHP family)